MLAKIGIVPGEKFDPAVAKGLEKAPPVAMEKLTAASKAEGTISNGWRDPPKMLGDWGTDFGTRAVIALVGLGADLPSDAFYPSCREQPDAVQAQYRRLARPLHPEGLAGQGQGGELAPRASALQPAG